MKPLIHNLPSASYLRLPGVAAVHGFVGLCWILEQFGFDNVIERGFRRTNENVLTSIQAAVAVPRLYLYSKADEMVRRQDVEEHAELARNMGCMVYMVPFETSSHVAHIREDETKYWCAVRRILERCQGSSGSVMVSRSDREMARL